MIKLIGDCVVKSDEHGIIACDYKANDHCPKKAEQFSLDKDCIEVTF